MSQTLHIIPSIFFFQLFKPLIDTGAHLDMIREDFAKELGLKVYQMERPQPVVGCFGGEMSKRLQYWTLFMLFSADGVSWNSDIIYALVTKRLAEKMLLGLIFLHLNKLIIDVEANTLIDKCTGYDLLRPQAKKHSTLSGPNNTVRLKQRGNHHSTTSLQIPSQGSSGQQPLPGDKDSGRVQETETTIKKATDPLAPPTRPLPH